MENRFHECRYVMHIEDYDAGVYFFREVLGLQPNYTWSIVPDNQGYRFYMGQGRPEIVKYPFAPKQGSGEIIAECRDLKLTMERMLEELPDVKILSHTEAEVVVEETNGNVIHLVQGECGEISGVIDKTNMFTGAFTGVFYEDDLAQARSFYQDWIGLELLEEAQDRCVFKAGDACLELRAKNGRQAGPSMIALEADSVNKMHDRLSTDERYKEVFVLHDTDYDARRFFQILDPSGNVVEFYAYLRNVREEILLH